MAPPGREPQEGVKVMESCGMTILPSVGSDRLVREMKTPTPFAPTVVEVGIVGPMPSRAPLTCAPPEVTNAAEKSRVASVAVASERHPGYRTAVVVRFLIPTSNRRPPVSVPRAVGSAAFSKYPEASICLWFERFGDLWGPPDLAQALPSEAPGIGSTHA